MKAKIQLISSMLIFGSIGIFVRNIEISSAALAFIRGSLASTFLIIYCVIARKKISIKAVKDNIILLVLSSAAMGFNWILLFQAYKNTTIQIATLSYYCAPIFVIIMSAVILKEKFSTKKFLCVLMAMLGMALIMMTSSNSDGNYNHLKGIFFGLFAAVLYASVIITNKFFKNLSGIETTLIQLLIAVFVLLPYLMLTDPIKLTDISASSVPYILILGLFHTGFAYYLYFSSIKNLSAQSIAALSYIDPISAVVFSAVILSEKMTFIQIIGGMLILGATIYSDTKRKSKMLSNM